MQFLQTTYAANEIDTFVRTQVFDAQQLIQNQIARNSYIQYANRIIGIGVGLGGEFVPAATYIQCKRMQCLRTIDRRTFVLNDEVLLQLMQELRRCHAVQVAHHAVIIHHVQLIVGEADREEVIVLLVAGVVRVLQFLLVAYECRGSRTVMAISDVHSRNVAYDACDCSYDSRVVNHPERVTEAVKIRYEVILRLSARHAGNDGIQIRAVRVGKEHRFDVRVVDAHMFHPVFLLVTACELMFLDAPFHIILHPRSHNKAVLCTTVHGLGIDVVFLFLVLHQPAFLFE